MTTKNSCNVLIASLSNKVPLVREVRKALKKIDADGRIFGADCNPSCIGRYFVDEFWVMPPIDRLDPAELVRYCRANEIRAVIPTRDGELLFFAEQRDLLNDSDIEVMIASPNGVRTCLDKKLFFDVLDTTHVLNPIATFDGPDSHLTARWVVKERFGAGARRILLDVSVDAARSSLNRFP